MIRAFPEVGAQVSSIRPYLQEPEQMRHSFQRLAKMGYRRIQLQWVNPDISPELVADAVKEAGLINISTQDYWHVVKEHLDYFIQLNKLCGSTNICISGIPESQCRSIEGIETYLSEVRQLTQQAAYHGMVVSFHPRKQEFALLEGKTLTDWVMEGMPEPFQLGLDLYHVYKAGLSMGDWIRRYSDRIEFVHFKDFTVRQDGMEVLMPVGQGRINWQDAFAACRACRIPWLLAEQEHWEKDAFLCMEESLHYMQEQLSFS